MRSRASRRHRPKTPSTTGFGRGSRRLRMRSRDTRKTTTTNSSRVTASGTTTRATRVSGCRRTLTGVTIRSATAPGSASDSAGAGSIPCRGASTRSTAGAGRTCITGIAGAGCRSRIITRGTPHRKRTRSDIPAMTRARATTDPTSLPNRRGCETMIRAGQSRPTSCHGVSMMRRTVSRTMEHGARQHRGASGGTTIRRGALTRIRGAAWRRCDLPMGTVLLRRAARREPTPHHRPAA